MQDKAPGLITRGLFFSMTPEQIQAEIDAGEGPTLSLAALEPREDNPRRNTVAAKQLARTIEQTGWGAPIVVQKKTGLIIAGHTRYKAAALLGLERVPVRELDVDYRRAQALALADNRVGEIAEWDFEALAKELETFSLDDAEALGFDSKYLEGLADKIAGFGPMDENPRLDELGEGSWRTTKCPECGHVFKK